MVIVGQRCTPEGQLPKTKKIDKILNQPVLTLVKDIRGFLGLCGTIQIWIPNYSLLARSLIELIRKNVDFEWTDKQQEAFNTLKKVITLASTFRSIDYLLENPVILSVDSSYITIGFILLQLDEEGRRQLARYRFLPMNKVEVQYSQPKLELYGLYWAL